MKVVEGNFGRKEDNKISAHDVLEQVASQIEEDAEVLVIAYEEGMPLLLANNVGRLDTVAMLLMMGQDCLMSIVYGGHDFGDDTVH